MTDRYNFRPRHKAQLPRPRDEAGKRTKHRETKKKKRTAAKDEDPATGKPDSLPVETAQDTAVVDDEAAVGTTPAVDSQDELAIAEALLDTAMATASDLDVGDKAAASQRSFIAPNDEVEDPSATADHRAPSAIDLPPVLNCDGEPVGTVFPETAAKTIINHSAYERRVLARSEDIEKTQAELDRSWTQVHLLLRKNAETAAALYRGASAGVVADSWSPKDPLEKAVKARWVELSAMLQRLNAEQTADEAEKNYLERWAVDVLMKMYDRYFEHPQFKEYEKVLEEMKYQPVVLPEPIASLTGNDRGRNRGETPENASGTRIPSELSWNQPKITDNVAGAHDRWAQARHARMVAERDLAHWQQARYHDIGRSNSPEEARQYIEEGRRMMQELKQAERTYSDAASEARKLRAVMTNELSAHFPRFSDGDAELEAMIEEENDASRGFTNMASVQRWIERTSPLLRIPSVVSEAPSLPEAIAALASIEYCESVGPRLQIGRSRRYIDANIHTMEQRLAAMLTNWPDDRISRPPFRRGQSSVLGKRKDRSGSSAGTPNTKRRRDVEDDAGKNVSDKMSSGEGSYVSARTQQSQRGESDSDDSSIDARDGLPEARAIRWLRRLRASKCDVL